MDAVFQLDEASRAEFLQLLVRSNSCTYICLRSYLHQANCLIGFDWWYNEENTPVGALPLFVEYQQFLFPLQNDHGLVPGFAFRNNRPYIELREPELQNRASNHTQRQFYQAAGIKTVVLMGCRSGEIELGSPNVINMEMEMRNYFPEDFSRQSSPQPTDPNRPSSLSSSLRSLLTTAGNPDSSLIFTIPTTSQPQPQQLLPTESTPTPTPTPTPNDPHQQAMQLALSQMRSKIQLPTLESENDMMTRAILAVLTSPPSSSSSAATAPQPQQTQNFPNNSYQLNPKSSAFKHYSSLLLGAPVTPARASLRAQSMLKQAISFYRKVRRDQLLLRSRPSSNQLQHMISERRRREKLNDSFTTLRLLLPSATKKDKASVLTSAREYLASLRAQIEELSRQNELLEAHVLPSREATDGEESGSILSSNERLNVRITPAPESTSEQRIVDMRVSVRGERPVVDILIHLLEFLKRDRNVRLMSIEAKTQITELGSVNHINFRLRIEGNGWDESTFQEAVRRLVADLAQ